MKEHTCANCLHYDGQYCTVDLNNLDYSYLHEGMFKDETETCERFELYEEEEG